jgi:hypothetical protein
MGIAYFPDISRKDWQSMNMEQRLLPLYFPLEENGTQLNSNYLIKLFASK